MNENLKSKSFKVVYWIMLTFLVLDTIDTNYRTITGYLGGGTAIPGANFILNFSTTDMIVFFIFQIGIIYGIYLLYKLKKVGGYIFLASNILFLIYASILGPIAEVSFSVILPMVALYFGIYIILVICIPWFYSEKFN
tara:strand:- start:932 stop:1345 length:414 start_codon:yes stop_codon:yes gene_type:complete